MIVIGEKPFAVMAHSMCISASESGYVLNYSSDGENFTAIEDETPANETMMVNNFAKGTIFKLVGNSSNVVVTF